MGEKKKMSSILDYARNEGETFAERPFGEVDSLILSWLSYMDYPEGEGTIRMLFLSELFPLLLRDVNFPEETLQLLAFLAASPRFRALHYHDYVELMDHDSEIQFGAVTFELPGEWRYVAFRGTDGTFIGWKEDLSMSLTKPVPSQLKAAEYLEEQAKDNSLRLMVGGHSKGGNLAVYAAANQREEVADRIAAIYSHDGPGFLPEDLKQPGFLKIRDRIRKSIPRSSLIGMMLEPECDSLVVKSSASGVSQHNPFTWGIGGSGFLPEEKLSRESRMMYKSVNSWVLKLDEESRDRFIDVTFELLERTGTENFAQFGSNLSENIPKIAAEMKLLDKDTRSFMYSCLKQLAASGVKNIPELFRSVEPEDKKDLN